MLPKRRRLRAWAALRTANLARCSIFRGRNFRKVRTPLHQIRHPVPLSFKTSFHRGFHEAIFFRSEEHTSELQSLMRISYAVFCLKKKKQAKTHQEDNTTNKD